MTESLEERQHGVKQGSPDLASAETALEGPEQVTTLSAAEVRRSFRLDVVAASFYSVFGLAIVTFPAVLARKDGASDLVVSLVIAAPAIAQLSTVFWSRFTQNMPKMKVMLGIGYAARLSLMLTLIAFNPLIFALVILLANTLEFAKMPAYASIMNQIYPDNRRGELMGKVRVVYSVVMVISAALLGAALEQYSYQVVYPVVALLGVISNVIFGFIRYRDEPATRTPTPLRKLLLIPRTDRRYGLFLWTIFLMGFFNLLASAVFPIVMVDELKVSNGFLGLVSAVQSFVSILAYFVWGKLSDRRHPAEILFLTFVFNCLIVFVYLIAWSSWLLILVAILTGISLAGADLATINVAIRFARTKEDIPHYLGLYSSLVGVRGIIAPFLAALMLNFTGTRAVLLVAFIGITISSLNFVRVRRVLSLG